MKPLEAILTGRPVTRRELLWRTFAALGGCVFAPRFPNAEAASLASALQGEPVSAAHALNVVTSPLTLPAKGATLHGYLSKPAGGGPHPAAILIHGEAGLSEHTRAIASRLASEGFVTLAVDLLSRKGGSEFFPDAREAAGAIAAIKDGQSFDDLDGALDYLAANASVKKDGIGIAGFSWGADQTLQYAAVEDRLKAAVVFDSAAPAADLIEHLMCPVMGLYGSVGNPAASKIPAVEARMKKLGRIFEATVYPGVARGFFDNPEKDRYTEAASREAWKQAVAFLRSNLG